MKSAMGVFAEIQNSRHNNNKMLKALSESFSIFIVFLFLKWVVVRCDTILQSQFRYFLYFFKVLSINWFKMYPISPTIIIMEYTLL